MQRGWRTTAVRGEVRRAPSSKMRVPSEWRPVPEEANRAVAVFGFDPEQARAALAFSMDAGAGGAGGGGGADMLLPLFVGDVVTLLQECEDGWYLGHSINNPGHKGVFPRSYVTALRKEDRPPIVDEISSVLREWNTHLREKFRQSGDGVVVVPAVKPDQQMSNGAAMAAMAMAIPVTPIHISGIMNIVMTSRRHLVGGKLTNVEAEEEQRKVTTKIDFLNRQLGMDLVVRDERGNRLTGVSDSAVAFYRQHKGSSEKSFGDGRMQQHVNNKKMGKAPAEQQRHSVSSSSFRIMMEVKNFISQKVSDFVELDFSIYEASKEGGYNMRPLCENFIAYWDRRNLDDPRRSREEMERRSNLRVLFTDIGKSDIKNRLFLVCKVVSEGDAKMKQAADNLDGKPRANLGGSALDLRQPEQDPHYRKPLGVAAIEITDLFTFKQGKPIPDGENEKILPFMLMSNENEPCEDVFRRLVFDEKTPTEARFLWVTLNVMLGDALQPLETRNLRHPVARKIGHPEVIMPSDERNELYLTLSSGEFSRPPGKMTDRNVEVIVKVCDRRGIAMKDSISAGVGAARVGDSYRSLVFYHNQKPRWNEVTKIMIDAHKFSECHLQFTFWHRSTRLKENREPFAMSFLKLEQPRNENTQLEDHSNTALKDDRYSLIVYKIEKGCKLDPTAYLDMPYLKKQDKLKQIKKNNLTLLPNDEMVVSTTLCSTKLTQNEGLRSLLQGKGDKGRLRTNLAAFRHSFDGREFVKFLPEAMDTLFSLLTETAESHGDITKVFEMILFALQHITDDKNQRFQHFMPMLDDYIATNFSATLAYSKLLEILKECVENADTKPKELTNAMKSLKYIMKFVVRSRMRYSEMNGGKGKSVFEEELKSVFESMERMMCSTNKDLQRAQVHYMEHIFTTIPDFLMADFNRQELSEIMMGLIQALPRNHLCNEKMVAINDLVKSRLFVHQECRTVMLQKMLDIIDETLADPDSYPKLINLATDTLGDILIKLHRFEEERPGSTILNVSTVMNTVLRTVIKMVGQRIHHDENARSAVANMTALLGAMRNSHYGEFIARFTEDDPEDGRRDLIDFVNEFLAMSRDLIENGVFPELWSSMILMQNSVCLRATRQLADTIRDCLKEPFESHAWSNLFHFAVKFITQESLQLEKFPESKRQKVYAQYKDMRKEMADIVKKMWFNLGKQKIRFIPEMVGPFLEMTLIPELSIRKETIPLFFDMMQCEYYSSRQRTEDGEFLDTRRDPTMIKANFREFEHEIICQLDTMVETAKKGDDMYNDLFDRTMMARCEEHTVMKESGTRLVRTVGKLMELLLEFRSIEKEDSKENQMSCIVNIYDFYKGIEYDELYVKYLMKLCSLHEQCENWAEAASTLQQYSASLEWSERPLKLEWKKHPECKTHRALKEKLCNDAIVYFEKGAMWEKSLCICKRLARQHEKETFDYNELSRLNAKMSTYYKNIFEVDKADAEIQQKRAAVDYFRVAFYGLGFPHFLQNKVFVYRGRGFEQLPSFQARIRDQFPNAELMVSLSPPSDEEKESPKQLLQINKVDPVMSEEGAKFQGKFLQPQVIDYYRANEVRRFTYSRPYQRGPKIKGNEHVSLWTDKTLLETKYSFPGVLQWFELSKPEELTHLSPIENAIDTMQKANDDLRTLIMKHFNPPQEPPLNELTAKLNGMIDAAVNGGTAMYEVFFTDAYPFYNESTQTTMKTRELEERLKRLMADQVPLLENGLKIHDMKKEESMADLHDHMESTFKKTRAEVQRKYGKGTCDIEVSRGRPRAAPRPPAASKMPPSESRSDLSRISTVSHQTSVVDSSKHRFMSAITRKKSSANDRTSAGRPSANITIEENGIGGGGIGGPDSNGSNTSSINLGNDDSAYLAPTVVITHRTSCSFTGGGSSSRPVSGHFLSSTPFSSRSPSVASNRESMVSLGGADDLTPVAEQNPSMPPPLPARRRPGSDPESASLSSGTNDDEKPVEREEVTVPQQLLRQKGLPPAVPVGTPPPTPPRKPSFKTSLD